MDAVAGVELRLEYAVRAAAAGGQDLDDEVGRATHELLAHDRHAVVHDDHEIGLHDVRLREDDVAWRVEDLASSRLFELHVERVEAIDVAGRHAHAIVMTRRASEPRRSRNAAGGPPPRLR
jgi:hypothetical protein